MSIPVPVYPKTVVFKYQTRFCNSMPSDNIPPFFATTSTPTQVGVSIGNLTFDDTCIALFDSSQSLMVPTNLDQLQALSDQFTLDFLNWQQYQIDEVFAGIAQVKPNAILQFIEFDYNQGECFTRISSLPNSFTPDRLAHYSSTVDSDCASRLNWSSSTPCIQYFGPPVTTSDFSGASFNEYLLCFEDGNIYNIYIGLVTYSCMSCQWFCDPTVTFQHSENGTALGFPVVSNGQIVSIVVTYAGTTSSYDPPVHPIVTISPPPPGGMQATAISTSGAVLSTTVSISASVTSVQVTNGGRNYTAATVTFSPPPTGVTATGTVTIFGGQVSSVNITNGGSGYSSPPTVSITGDGAGALGIAMIGRPYTMATATFSPSDLIFLGGVTATGTANIVDGIVESITLTNNGGSGYTANPTITIAGDGQGCIATAIAGVGIITSTTITNPGSGYTTGSPVPNQLKLTINGINGVSYGPFILNLSNNITPPSNWPYGGSPCGWGVEAVVPVSPQGCSTVNLNFGAEVYYDNGWYISWTFTCYYDLSNSCCLIASPLIAATISSYFDSKCISRPFSYNGTFYVDCVFGAPPSSLLCLIYGAPCMDGLPTGDIAGTFTLTEVPQ